MGKSHMAFGTLFTAVGLPVVNEVAGLDLSTTELLVGITIGTIAGVLPDIDHPNSLITMGIIPGSKFFGPIGKAAGFLLSLPPRIVGMAVRQVMNHRGGTHSLLFAIGWALLAAPAYALMFTLFGMLAVALAGPVIGLLGVGNEASTVAMISSSAGWLGHHIMGSLPLISISVFLGYIAHLYSDSLTRVPVPWPWPLKIGGQEGRWFFLPKGMRILTNGPIENGVVKPLVMVLAAAAVFAFTIWPPLNDFMHRDEKGRAKSTPTGILKQGADAVKKQTTKKPAAKPAPKKAQTTKKKP